MFYKLLAHYKYLLYMTVLIFVPIDVSAFWLIGDKYPKRLPVVESSEYLGNEFYTTRPLVFIKNLPNYKDRLPEDYRRNGLMILAEESNSYLTKLGDRFTHSKEYLFSNFRAKFIPVGTKLTVFDEYRHYHYKGFNLGKGDTDIHMLLVNDDRGDISVISEIGFKIIMVSESYSFKPSVYDNQFSDNFEALGKEKTLTLYYEPNSSSEQAKVNSFKKIKKLISFFKLEDEIVVSAPSSYCQVKHGDSFINWSNDSCEDYFENVDNDLVSGAIAKITFKSKESFVTAYQFMESWNLSNERMSDRKSQIKWWKNMREEKNSNRTIEFK